MSILLLEPRFGPSFRVGRCSPQRLGPIVHAVAGLKRWYDAFLQSCENKCGHWSTKSGDQRSDLGFASLGDSKYRRLAAARLGDNSSTNSIRRLLAKS
jgi:hypothetical protein